MYWIKSNVTVSTDIRMIDFCDKANNRWLHWITTILHITHVQATHNNEKVQSELHCVSKTHQLSNCKAQNCKNRFWWHSAEIFKRLVILVGYSTVLRRFVFLSTFRISNQTPKITRILTRQLRRGANFFTARCTIVQSAVLRSHVVCPLSVRL